jgi:hypothetical protein
MNRSALFLTPLLLAAAPMGVVLPGTMVDALSHVVIDATHTAYCMVNPTILGNSGQQTFATLGPNATLFHQNTNTGPVIVNFQGLAEGELITSGTSTYVGYNYYGSGPAVLSFASATTGIIVFLGAGNTIANKTYAPIFNSFATSFDGATGRLFVSFGIVMGPCAVPFRAAFQS